MTNMRKTYEDRSDAQSNEWNAQIERLKARADNARAEAQIEYYKAIDTLERKHNYARVKLGELKTVGNEAWEDLKTGAEKAWSEVKTAYHDASSQFK